MNLHILNKKGAGGGGSNLGKGVIKHGGIAKQQGVERYLGE